MENRVLSRPNKRKHHLHSTIWGYNKTFLLSLNHNNNIDGLLQTFYTAKAGKLVIT